MKCHFFLIGILIFLVSCKTEKIKILSTFPDGKPASEIIYPDKNDTTSCRILVYHDNGKPKLELTIKDGKYVGNKITYFHNGKVHQIDSLSQPCDTSYNECDGSLIRYYENGNIS